MQTSVKSMIQDEEQLAPAMSANSSLRGLFFTVLLLVAGGFCLSIWDVRHDREIAAIAVSSPP